MPWEIPIGQPQNNRAGTHAIENHNQAPTGECVWIRQVFRRSVPERLVVLAFFFPWPKSFLTMASGRTVFFPNVPASQ